MLVRLFTRDDPSQASAADAFIADCAENRDQIFVAMPVFCELVWVLRSEGFPRSQIAECVEALLTRQIFRIDRENLVRMALDRYRNGKGDFADYLIGAIAEDAGCRDTVSFDRDLKGAPGFTIL
ncbi:MAG TPA: type II toxin-antitoxin system VapC family toxin [Bryobacteraceae bacterium]|nr:type II toxin-antitoxin system VapC family toxin [Bryobacteraceae bacterium]